MNIEIKIPQLGESISEAIVSNLLRQNGDIVAKDEPIVELETDKVNQVLSAPEAGKLSVNVKQGDTVKIGQSIGSIDPLAAKDAPPATKSAPEPQAAVEPTPKPAPVSHIQARKPVEEFAKDTPSPIPSPSIPKQSAPTNNRKKMTSLRKTIAQKLVEVKNTTAMLTTFNEVDMSKVMEIRAGEKDAFLKKYNVRLGFMSFFVKAAVSALKTFPQVNAYIDKDEIITLNTYDIGVAISTEKGLMVPVLRDCEKQSFGQVEASIEAYAKKAREGAIAIEDLRGGSFTITNGGTFGSLLSTPILNPPQSAILGMHSIQKRAVVVEDEIVIRPMMYLALSYDHRLIDGKEAVQFLVHIKQCLEEPSRILLEL